MGYFANYIASGKYKRFVRHQWGYYPGEGPLYNEPEFAPLPNSDTKLWNVLRVTVVDDVGLIGSNFYYYFYLYDFTKNREVVRKKQVIYRSTSGGMTGNAYYDDMLEEKLGGKKEVLGG